MPAPKDNQFAAKPRSEKRTEAKPIYLRPTLAERKEIMRWHAGEGSLSAKCLNAILAEARRS